MSRPVTKPFEKKLAVCCSSRENSEPTIGAHTSCEEEFSLDCTLRAIRVGKTAGLLARVRFPFGPAMSITKREALNRAEVLNHLLLHSKVFVTEDIDGDGRCFLYMDTLLQGRYQRESIRQFLDFVTQDIEITLSYLYPKQALDFCICPSLGQPVIV